MQFGAWKDGFRGIEFFGHLGRHRCHRKYPRDQRRKANISACPIQAMADLFLRYLRFLLFNPKPMSQLSEFPAPLGAPCL